MEIGSRHPERTKRVLKNIQDPEFWSKLNELNAYLQPLAIASNVSQASDTRLDHILITFGNLYRIFNGADVNPSVRDCVCGSLERRWGKASQDTFILAVFFNPYIRCRLFNPSNPAFCANGLYTTVKRVFERVFKKTPDSGLFEAFVAYYGWAEEFSTEHWHLTEYSEMYKRDNKDVNLLALWATLPSPGLTNTGRGQLACLARRLLSVVANSAGAERLFSRMGTIHTKRRNRLHHTKVHDLATVAMDLEAQHRAAGLTRKRAKRRFDDAPPQPAPALRQGDEDDAEPESLSDSDSEASGSDTEADLLDEVERAAFNLTALAAQLTKAVDDDEDEDEVPEDLNDQAVLPGPSTSTTHEPTRPRVRLFFGTAHAIPLRELFNFSESIPGVEEGLGIFWRGGIRNFASERSVYEAVTSEKYA